MQNSISQHTNPMKQKRPFIKKSRTSNLSFISKPNLSITKASHRFSVDKTFISTQHRQQSYLKTARDTHNEFIYPQILQQLEQPNTARASLQAMRNQQFVISRRRNSFNYDRSNNHKQKLHEILQSIDLNNTMIQQLFECDEEICYFKDQIKKTQSLYQNLHKSLKTEINEKKKLRQNKNEPYIFEQKRKDIENVELCNKISQLRQKRLSFKHKQNTRYTTNDTLHDDMNKTFT